MSDDKLTELNKELNNKDLSDDNKLNILDNALVSLGSTNNEDDDIVEEDTSEIDDAKFLREKRRAYKKLKKRRQKLFLKKINAEYNPLIKKLQGFTMSKFLMLFIFGNCTLVEVYSMYTMYVFRDLSPLTTLIASVITESISYAIYCAKSYKSKKSEVDSQLERDKFTAEVENIHLRDSMCNVPVDTPPDGDIPEEGYEEGYYEDQYDQQYEPTEESTEEYEG